MAEHTVTEKEIDVLKQMISLAHTIDAEARQRILASVAIFLGLVSADTCAAVLQEATERRRT